jgi:hypothetical protein
MRTFTEAARARIEAVIAAHRPQLGELRGFLGAEPGFRISGGKLIREPAIIVYVDRKLPETHLLAVEAAPAALGGVPVDVVQADPWKQLELNAETSAIVEEFTVSTAPRKRYEPLPGNPIDEPLQLGAPILCHAGPDSGWVVLRDFLAATEDRLTVAIYDFSADYLARTLIDTGQARDLDVVLTIDDDRAAPEIAIQDRLKQAFGPRYRSAVIFCRGDMRFPSAYHPKVAVQDGKRFWLSSGNWSPASQPEIDPVGTPATATGMYSRGNREWHLVVEDETLAGVFEAYIEHDKEQADGDANAGLVTTRTAMPDLFVPIDALVAAAAEAAAAPVTPVAPRRLPTDGAPFTVRPLLSPDNYAARADAWIRGAERSLYLQYAYINYSKAAGDEPFRALLDHLIAKSWDDDFDLRIIISRSTEKARALAEAGLNEKVLRVQSRVHNKGIVRDGNQVLVSSQNWSGDGFLRNRDAGLIIDHPQVAAYFRDLFLDDWANRADDPFAVDAPPATLAPAGAPAPPGMVRMSWSEYFGQ